MSRPLRAAALLGAAAVLAGSLTGCGGSAGGEDKDADRGTPAADLSTCKADATAAPKPYGAAFPTGWPFPPETVVFDAEDRGADGTIVSGTSSASFKDVLASMNQDVTAAGFTNSHGETEKDDAESNWSGHGFHGRWAIRVSAKCPGETVVQVLSAAD